MRKVVIAGNWKMHKPPREARAFVGELAARLEEENPAVEVIVAPPFVSIHAAVEAGRGTTIRVAAQNVHWEDQGAFTGEVSGGMLRESGCTHVIIGHSERRQYFGETDETVNKRLAAALRHGLVPVFCLGETLEEREGGRTFEVIERQLTVGMAGIRPPDPERFMIAYEPVWAIGTGKTATPEQAQEVHAFLREKIGSLSGADFAQRMPLLYGGSVKPDNTRGLLARPDIDGGLVGGACLKIDEFMGIIRQAT